jgi:alpha-2-macroglobulin
VSATSRTAGVSSGAGRDRRRRGVIAAMMLVGLCAAPLHAQAPSAPPKRPANAAGTVIVPDHFLRRWDPVTVFFDRDLGPAAGGPEDQPSKLVTVKPAHAGAYQWLDARTLQFRPADPWPSLTRFTWTVDGRSTTLATLMAAPVETVPAEDSSGLEPVQEIRLTFAEPLSAEALGRMVGIELRPLPGVDGAQARWLTREDFSVKPLERGADGRASYLLVFKQDVPLGTRIVVHLRLSLDDKASVSFKDLSYSTAEPFRVLTAGCREKQYPITPTGSRYSREQAIACGADERVIVVDFSATPKDIGPVVARNLVRFTPSVANLAFGLSGRTLEIKGDFASDTLYGLALVPASMTDTSGRSLDLRQKSELYVHFPRKAAFVRWTAGAGLVERLGAQMVPVEGRGQERVDVRIHAIPPLDRSFWPFPDQPVTTDDAQRPAGPGEEPKPYAADRAQTVSELAAQIAALGSPAMSAIVTLPLRREGSAASFGLDLAPHLERVSGKGQPGTYLVGLRDIAAGTQRAWMRVQVTDLTLSTFEEPDAVRFAVTSLSTGQPVAGARVSVQGTSYANAGHTWVTLAEGVTDVDGGWRWKAPGFVAGRTSNVKRLLVQKADDTLALDATRPPERYADNQWATSREGWLQWTVEPLAHRLPPAETLAHIFTERPVYRPDEEVHLKGYLRRRQRGRLQIVPMSGWLIVEGPGDLAWKYPLDLSGAGSFHHTFQEKDLPTGSYRAHFEDQKRENRWGHVSFSIEAYRIPTFEVSLHAPDQVALDKEFDVSLTAAYYAGGKVGGQPVQWRVSQFPYAWTPKKREGFLYSSDGRFSRTDRFQSSPRLQKDDTTADDGSSKISLNPTLEPTAHSRTYVVEATVTGPDDQTVTATRSILALPAFVLGLKAPRFIERAKEIAPEVLVVGHDGEPVVNQEVVVRLLRREWHSHLRASDFSDGVARYLTDVVDEKVSETKVRSTAVPLVVRLPIDRAGVYVVELESRDRLDRAQVVSVDLFAGGDERIAWPKPATKVFSVSTDQTKYEPGATAAVVLKSPFQSARALAVVEAPEGNLYQWVPVENGTAVFRLPILATYTPRVPVHFLLMRGRLPGAKPTSGNSLDLGKPATLAATAWLEVSPVGNQMTVDLQYPKSARPGQRIEVTITLKDPKGKPLPGEVTLWLVDQAVLALGKEQRLDPLPDFITKVVSRLQVRDTRNLAFGELPFAESPGGDGGEEDSGLLDRATVRKNFKPVPYYNPAILVGPDGVAKVTIDLSDDLTNFKLRAKAVSGAERFGFATGHLPIRLPVIVQPALPRFVRPGDRFVASAIGRIVEGAAGPGIAQIRAEGVSLSGPGQREVTFIEGRPERLDFPVSVSTPAYTADGKLSRADVTFRVAVERTSDKASDAFEVKLPLRDDRERIRRRQMQEITPGQPLAIAAIAEAARPGTIHRSVLLSDQPALVRMAAGLDFLLEYPYACTEQRVSRARAYVAFRKFRALLKQDGTDTEVQRAVKDAHDWIGTAIDPNGLVAYWPGSEGFVSLTAWSVQFLVEAKQAGFPVDEKLLGKLTATLERALRSDYSRFIDGEAFTERAWALAALAQAGQFNPAYAAELSRKAEFLDLDGVAEVVQAFGRTPDPPRATIDALVKGLWDGLIVRLHQGREIYGGLQTRQATRNGLILPSETRTLAEITRAVARVEPTHPRLPVLVNALVTLGREDGWGTTNANASAMLALAERLEAKAGTGSVRVVNVKLDGKDQAVSVGGAIPIAMRHGTTLAAGEVAVQGGEGVLVARVDTTYVPEGDGGQVAAQSDGFVVSRELLRVHADGTPPTRTPLTQAGTMQTFGVGDVVEEHVQVVNPKARNYVAVVVPLAAGVEPMNPRLATSPPEARPSGALTVEPTYASFQDDHVAFYYNTLPAGTYDFYFRTRATIPGTFVQPPAKAEMMYDGAVRGNSNGARIVVERK